MSRVAQVCEPAGEPDRVETFTVRSGAPKAGWWPIAISADTAAVEISASNVHDPVPSLLTWLERLVSGNAARVLVDEEGDQTEILVYPKERGLVRFVVFHYGDADEKRIDVLLKLRNVVVQFYAALQELAKDEDLFKKEWVFHVDANSVAKPPFSSKAVEAFLSGVRSG